MNHDCLSYNRNSNIWKDNLKHWNMAQVFQYYPIHCILIESGPGFNIKTFFPGIGIPIIKRRRSWDRLLFIMGIPILARQHLYIVTAPCSWRLWVAVVCTVNTPFAVFSIWVPAKHNHQCWRQLRNGPQQRTQSTLKARFMGPTWGPSGADRTQVGQMMAPWTLLSG